MGSDVGRENWWWHVRQMCMWRCGKILPRPLVWAVMLYKWEGLTFRVCRTHVLASLGCLSSEKVRTVVHVNAVYVKAVGKKEFLCLASDPVNIQL